MKYKVFKTKSYTDKWNESIKKFDRTYEIFSRPIHIKNAIVNQNGSIFIDEYSDNYGTHLHEYVDDPLCYSVVIATG
jgi:hypothetical protein